MNFWEALNSKEPQVISSANDEILTYHADLLYKGYDVIIAEMEGEFKGFASGAIKGKKVELETPFQASKRDAYREILKYIDITRKI